MMKTKRIDPENVDLDYLRKQFGEFRSNLLGMKDKVSGNTADVLDQMGSYLDNSGLSSRLSSLESELESIAAKLKDSGKDAVALGMSKGKQAVTRVEAEVTERPIASIAIAFGVGLLVSQFLRRS